MDNLDAITERIRADFTARNAARDAALERSRQVIRQCALCIRATHRNERAVAREHLEQAARMLTSLRADLTPYPQLFYAGYIQDAFKEFAEANIVHALLAGQPLPEPETLGVDYAPYLNGLGEAAGELRRRCLDIIRHDHSDEAERLLALMDEIYAVLVTMDYPDALTDNLRRTTDLVRGVTERTRGDISTSLRQYQLQEALKNLERRLGAP